MAPATIANKSIEIEAGEYNLRAGTSKILFDGFLKLYNDAEEDEQEADAKIPDLEVGDKVVCKEIIIDKRYLTEQSTYKSRGVEKL